MSESKETGRTGAQEQTGEDPNTIGGEVRVSFGAAPRVLRWIGYVVYVWAIVYLLVHPSIEYRIIILIFAGILGAWLLFYGLTKRPPEP